MKELLLSQSAFCFLKVQGQDVIALFLSFLMKIQSRASSPEHPQRYGVISAHMLSSFCVHLMLFLQSWSTTAKHQDWLNLPLEEGKMCCCLAFTPASDGAQPGRMILRVEALKIHTKAMLQYNNHLEKGQCLSGAAKTQSTRLKSKGPSTTWPCQRWNGLLVLILARLWTGFVDIFLKKSNCPGHIQKERDTLYLFLPLSRKSLFHHLKARGPT